MASRLGRFTQMPFNRGRGRKEVRLRMDAGERLDCMVGFGANLKLWGQWSEQMYGQAAVLVGLPLGVAGMLRWGAAAGLALYLKLGGYFGEQLRYEGTLGQNIALNLNYVERCEFCAEAGKNWKAAAGFGESCRMRGSLGTNLYGGAWYSELLRMRVDLEGMTFGTARIGVLIPPGGELRIDSRLFTASLGGQNVLHEYSGDWLTLGRGVRRLEVDSGTGGRLTGSLVYQERYL